jgi:hypothetical protein
LKEGASAYTDVKKKFEKAEKLRETKEEELESSKE